MPPEAELREAPGALAAEERPAVDVAVAVVAGGGGDEDA